MQTKLSYRLKALRKNLNLNANYVITKLNCISKRNFSVQSLYKWEQGNAVPELDIITYLARIYHCHISYLIEEKSIEYKKLTSHEIFYLKYYRTDFLFRSIAIQIRRRLEK